MGWTGTRVSIPHRQGTTRLADKQYIESVDLVSIPHRQGTT